MNRRWTPTLTMMLVSTISYIDRTALAQLIPTIQRETGMTTEQYGWVVSAFSIAYMLGNPAWGAALDRVGVRLGMTAAVALWSVASALHAFAASFASFAAFRFLLGFGEGATFPGALRTALQTLPPDNRARGIAISYSGGSLGAIITPLVITPVALAFGWRGAFLFTGLLGVAWIAWWRVLSRRADILESRVESREDAPAVSWRDPRLWSFLASYSFGALPLGFILYTGALYLSRVHGVSQADLAWLMWIPPAGWEAGYFFWGWLCDREMRGTSSPVQACRQLMGVSMLLSLPLVFAPRIASVPLLMAELFLAMFVTSGFIIPSINYATRIYSLRNASFIGGLGAGSFGVVTAATMPIFGRLFDQSRYQDAFALAAVFPVIGYAVWAWVNRK